MTTFWSNRQKTERAKLRQAELTQKHRRIFYLQTRHRAREGGKSIEIKTEQETGEGATERHSDKTPIWGKARLALPLLLLLSLFIPLANAIPSGIITYVPITFTNYQSTAVSANTPLSIVFNALAYQTYESNTLNNTELFYGNGTIAQSWMEGNYSNGAQQTNTLYTSNTVMFWFKSPNTNTWLPANTGTAPTQTIYLGFAGILPTSANNLWSMTDGVAPQLSPSYGQYDNGNNIFGFYENFAGFAMPPTWWQYGTFNIGWHNNLDMGGNAGWSGLVSDYYVSLPSILEMYGYRVGTNCEYDAIGTYPYLLADNGGAMQNWNNCGKPWFLYSLTRGDLWTGGSPQSNTWYVTTAILTSTTEEGMINYGTVADSGIKTGGGTAGNFIIDRYGNDGWLTYNHYQWVRVRIYPPSGIMPSVSYGSPIHTSPINIANNPTAYGTPGLITATPTSSSYLITATAIGGGAGGQQGGGINGGYGGGGGASATNTFNVIPGNIINYVVGGAGTTTWFGGSSGSPMVSASGGSGQTGGTTGVGSTIYAGGIGGSSIGLGVGGGGGGGGAGQAGAGGFGGTCGPYSFCRGPTIGGIGGLGNPRGGYGGMGGEQGAYFGFAGLSPGGGGGGGATGAYDNPGYGASGEIQITFANSTTVLLTSGSTWTVPPGSSDALSLGYCLGSGSPCHNPTTLSNGLGTVSYTVCEPNCLGVGNYNITVNDITIGLTYSTILQIYVPLTISNIISGSKSSQQITYPASPYTWNSYYPIVLNLTSPEPNAIYSLTSSPLLPNLPTGVANVYYVPPASIATGDYVFTLTEGDAGNPNPLNIIVAANTLNMNDIASPIVFNGICTGPTQYLPNCARTPNFNANPTSSYLLSDNGKSYGKANTIYQGNSIYVWSNANQTFTSNIILTYEQFSPAITFLANCINNPLACQMITQTPWETYNQSTTPAAPYTRRVITINGYNESSGNPLSIITSMSSSLKMNNYTIPMLVTTPMTNSINIYVATGNYVNPTINFTNQVLSSSNTPYYISKINYPFSSPASNGNWLTYSIYMAPTSLSSSYSFTAYQCSGFAQGDYVQAKEAATGTLTQQYYISAGSAFSIPLINGAAYSLSFFTSLGRLIYATSAAVWPPPPSATTLYLPCPSNFTPIIEPAITTACTSANAPGNQLLVTCTGNDTNNMVSGWTINFINMTTLLTSSTMNTVNRTGPTFTASFSYPSNHTQWKEQVIAYLGSLSQPFITYTFISGPLPGFSLPYGMAFFAIFLVLLPICLSYFHRSAMLLLEIFVIIIGQMLGILSFTEPEIGFFIILCGIAIVVDYVRR